MNDIRITLISAGAPDSPLTKVRKLLWSFCSDGETKEEIERDLKMFKSPKPELLEQDLANLEAIITADLPSGTLTQLVMHDANRSLDTANDETARVWLKELAEIVRKVLKQEQ